MCLANAAEQCTVDDVLARSNQVQAACCDTTTDCSQGWPTACNHACARVYIPFFEECHAVIRDIAGGELSSHQGLVNYDDFRDSCLEATPGDGQTPFSICDIVTSVITEPRGNLVDGTEGSQFVNQNIDCSVLIQAPEGERIAIKFQQMNLDPQMGPWVQPSNNPDYVRLYDGNDVSAPEIAWLSGLNVDNSAWVSRTNKMFITFSAGFQATAHDFSAIWVFSGSGATCSLNQHGDLLEEVSGGLPQLPAHANLGTCADASVVGRSDGYMDSGQSCSLACSAGFGINADLVMDDQGDVAPTYGLLRDMVVCFDGTLELHQFTCERQSGLKINICQPPQAVLGAPTGKLTDGSGSAEGTEGQVMSNSDCGVLLQAAEGQRVAVKFNAFDVALNDRLTLYDGPDASAPVIAWLFGDFTCGEDTADCDNAETGHEMEMGEPLSAIMVGGYSSSGRSMFVHWSAQRKPHAMQVLGSEGFTMVWKHSDAAEPCFLDHRPIVRAPAFGSTGDCTVQHFPIGLPTGGGCNVACDDGLRKSSEVSDELWRTIHAFGPAIAEEPMCWDGKMINLGSITCLQPDTCSNWDMGSSPTLAGACEIFPNTAPYPGQTGTYADCSTPSCSYESGHGIGPDVWYKMAVISGKTYTVSTRLGSSTFTWMYLIDSVPPQMASILGPLGSELASCIYCRASPDHSSLITWTADATKTIYIKVHGTAWSGDGWTLSVDCEDCPPPPPPPGHPDLSTCVPLPDPDGTSGGVDTSQCRGVHINKICTVSCDADRLYEGEPVDYRCGTTGEVLNQWTALDGGFPTCTRVMGEPEPEPGMVDPCFGQPDCHQGNGGGGH